jgi:hypothetical protein
MEDIANAYKISVGKPSAKRPTRIIRLRGYNEKDLTETGGEYTDWINLVADRVQWLTPANKVMQIRVPQNARNFLTS